MEEKILFTCVVHEMILFVINTTRAGVTVKNEEP